MTTVTVTIRIPTQRRALTGGAGEVAANGATVGEALRALDAAHPGLCGRIFDDTGRLRRFVSVFVSDEDVRFLDGLDTTLASGEVVSIVPALSESA